MHLTIGFGPKTTWNSFHQSGTLVAQELEKDARFTCGFFSRDPFSLDEMTRFDVLIFVKHYPSLSLLRALKQRGKILILDFHDKALWPNIYEARPWRRLLKRIYYLRTEMHIKAQLRLFDVCFVASPALETKLTAIGVCTHFLPRQIYNHGNELTYKQHTADGHSVVLYWTGVGANQKQNDAIISVLKRLHDSYKCRIVYSSDTAPKESWIEYRRWSRDGWEHELLEADIAFRWRDDSPEQTLKDPNKVLSYMAAGLPIVIYPTASEKMIVHDGENGFFADTPEMFEKKIVQLITDSSLRKRVGEAAHQEVWSRYSLRTQVEQIKEILLQLAATKKADRP